MDGEGCFFLDKESSNELFMQEGSSLLGSSAGGGLMMVPEEKDGDGEGGGFSAGDSPVAAGAIEMNEQVSQKVSKSSRMSATKADVEQVVHAESLVPQSATPRFVGREMLTRETAGVQGGGHLTKQEASDRQDQVRQAIGAEDGCNYSSDEDEEKSTGTGLKIPRHQHAEIESKKHLPEDPGCTGIVVEQKSRMLSASVRANKNDARHSPVVVSSTDESESSEESSEESNLSEDEEDADDSNVVYHENVLASCGKDFYAGEGGPRPMTSVVPANKQHAGVHHGRGSDVDSENNDSGSQESSEDDEDYHVACSGAATFVKNQKVQVHLRRGAAPADMLSKSVGHLRTWSSSCTRRDHEENYNRQQRSRSTADVTGGKNKGSTTRGTYQFISSYREQQGIIDEEAEDQQARRVRGKKERNMKNALRVGVGAVGGGQQKSVTNDSVGHDEQQTKQQYLRNDQEKSKEASYNHLRHAASLQLSKNSSRWQHEMKNASGTSTPTTSSAGKNSLNSLLSSGKQNLKVIPPRRSQKSLCTTSNKGVDHSTHHDETGTTSAPALFPPIRGFSSAGKMAESLSLSNQEEIKVMKNYKANNTDSVTPPYAFSATAVPKLNLGHLLLTSRTSAPASAPDLAVSKQNLQSKMPFWDQDVNKKAVYEEHVQEDLDNVHATTSKTPEVVNNFTYAAETTTVPRNASLGGASWKKMNSVSPCSAASTECPKISMMDLTGCTSMLGGDGATSVSGGGGGGSCGGRGVAPGSSSSTVEGASCFVDHTDTTAHDLSTFISTNGAEKEMNVTTCNKAATSSATTGAGQTQQLSDVMPTVLFEPPQPASSWSEEDDVDSRAIETKSGSTVYRNKPALPDPDATSTALISSATQRSGVANPYTIFQNARPDEKVTLRTPRGFEVQPADRGTATGAGAAAYAKEPAAATAAAHPPVAQVVPERDELPGIITPGQREEHQEQEIFHPRSPRMHRLLSAGSSCGTTTSLARRGCAPTTRTFNASSSNINPSTSCTNKVIRKVVGGGQRFLAPPPPLQHTLMGVGTVLQPGSLSRRNSASRFSSPVSRGVTERNMKNTAPAPAGNVTTSTSMLRRSLCPSPSAVREQRPSDEDTTLVKNHSGGGGSGTTTKIVRSLQQSTTRSAAACPRTTTPLSMSPVVLSPRPLPGTSQILAAKTEQNKVAIPTPTSIKFSLGLTPPKLSLFPPGIGGGGDRDEMNKDGGGQEVKLQAQNKAEADASTWENGNEEDVFVEQDVDVPSDSLDEDDQELHHAMKNPPQNSSERVGTNAPVPVARTAAASPSGIDNEVICQQAYARTTVGDGNALCDNHFEDFQMQCEMLHHGKIEGCFAPAGATAEEMNQQTTILGRGRSASRFLRPGGAGTTARFQFSDRRNGSLEKERKMMGVTTTRLVPQLRSASVQPKSMQHQLHLEVESATTSTSSTSRRRLLQPSPSLSASSALRSKSSMPAAGSFLHQMNYAGNQVDAGKIGVVIPQAAGADQPHQLKTGNKTKFVTPTLQEPKIPAPAAHAGLRPLWSPREQLQPPRPEQGEMKQSSLTSCIPVIPVVTTSTTSQQQEHQEAEVQRPPSAVSCSLPSGTTKISSGSATPAQLLTTPRQLLQPAQQTAALSATSFLFQTRGPPHSSAVPSPIPTPRFGFGRDSRKNSNTFSFGNLATSSRLPFPLQAGTSGCLLAKNSSPSAPSR